MIDGYGAKLGVGKIHERNPEDGAMQRQPGQPDMPGDGGAKKASARQPRSRWRTLKELSGNPLLSSLIAVGLTGLLGTYIAGLLTDASHRRDVEAATRTDALVSVKDLSDLLNERRERAAMVASSVRRAAPQAETDSRKHAYDEAYIAWNAKAPGDMLRIRAALQSAATTTFQRYVDGLANAAVLVNGVNADALLHAQQQPSQPGLLNIMDACLTSAYDTYRLADYKSADAARRVLDDCKFQEDYKKVIFCFSSVAEAMYATINLLGREQHDADYRPGMTLSEAEIVAACTPPPGIKLTSASAPVQTADH